jgi:hypothetical protein
LDVSERRLEQMEGRHFVGPAPPLQAAKVLDKQRDLHSLTAVFPPGAKRCQPIEA